MCCFKQSRSCMEEGSQNDKVIKLPNIRFVEAWADWPKWTCQRI